MANGTLRRLMALGISGASAAIIPLNSFADSLNLTTWYPAPYGVYSQLRSTGNSYFAYQGGNVGIGTANSSYPLEITGGSDVRLRISNASNSHFQNPELMISDVGDPPGMGAKNFRLGVDTNDYFYIRDTTAPGWPHRLVIDTNGNVGIGTTSPDSKVEIRYNAPADGFGIRNDATLIPATLLGVAAPNDTSGQGHLIYTTSGGVNRFYVNTNGRVVVGDAGDPNAILYVGGNALKPGGGSWGDWSDIRLKKNVRPLEGSLGKLLSLRGVSFEWKEPEKIGHRRGRQTGMIAQEVEKVFPEWIDEDKDGLKTLTYRGFEALAVESIRELRNEITALRSENAELARQIGELKSKPAPSTH